MNVFIGWLAAMVLIVWVLFVPAWAGEKEELELKFQNLNLQAYNLELQKRLSVAKEAEELNKRVKEFQKEVDSKGYLITPDGKLAEKPKPNEPKEKAKSLEKK